MPKLTSEQLAAPRPWALVDHSKEPHPFVAIESAGRNPGEYVVYRYAPLPHNVADFALIVEVVNANAAY